MKIFFTIIALLFALQVNSQPVLEWVRLYNDSLNNDDIGHNIIIDLEGNIICTGEINNPTGHGKIIIIKYDRDGNLIWKNIFSLFNIHEENPIGSVIDSQSNIYILSEDFFSIGLTKWDTSAFQLFAKKISNQNFEGIKLLIDKVNNIYVLYMINGINIILKCDQQGNKLWEKRIDGNYIWLYNASLDHNNNLYVSGTIYGVYDDLLLIKYSPSGDSLWSVKYNSGYYDFGMFLCIDQYDNVIVTGLSEGSPFGFDFYLIATIKYNSSGNMLWLRKYNGSGWGADEPKDITCDNENSVYVTGYSKTAETGEDFVTIKYNSNGDSLWVKKYNGYGNHNDISKRIAIDKFQNVFITGYSQIPGSGTDITTIKYDEFGVEKWITRFPNPDTNYFNPLNLVLDTSNNIYINSSCFFQNENLNIITLKYYDKPIGIHPISTEIPEKFSLSQNYPNPFNPSTTIKLALPPSPQGEGLGVRVIVYDILGRVIETLINETLQPGTYEVEWDGSAYSSGIYYYRLETNEFSQTKKMILIK